MEHGYSFGIEEEYFVVEPASRRAIARMPRGLMQACRRRVGERATTELLQSQIEVATPICRSSAEARIELEALRDGVSRACGERGLAIIASGTHPFAEWRLQQHTEQPRYAGLIDDFQIVGRRNLFCGLHVHVEPPPGVDRVMLMNRLVPWLPAFLALSTSSPFWKRRRTGLMSYRQAAYDEWPRTGTPDLFVDEAAYLAFVEALVAAGAIPDASYVWWTIRPSARYPTLELRIADSCTALEDALCLAALFRCLLRALARTPARASGSGAFVRLIAEENRWRAKRYGLDDGFLAPGRGALVPFESMLDELLAFVAGDAADLDCGPEVAHVRTILRRGTSAHRQLAIYQEHRERGETRLAALKHVVDWLVERTRDTANARAPVEEPAGAL
jgi:carboxylate-amine ligase